jgi:outer membrane protein TolC
MNVIKTSSFSGNKAVRQCIVYMLILMLPGLVNAQTFTSVAAMNDSATIVYMDRLAKLAENYYPQNEYFRGKVDVMQEGLYQAKWSWLNTLSMSYQYNPKQAVDNSTTSSIFPQFGIGITVNIGNIFLTPSRVTQANAELKASQASLSTQISYIRAEVKRRFAKYLQSLDMLKIRQRAVNDSESEVEYIKHKFEKGETTIDEYNKVLRSYTDNLQGKVTSEGDVLYTKISVEELIGMKLEDVK